MYPAIIAAAFFTAVLLNDLAQNQTPMEIGKHVFFGFIAVFGLWALEFREMGIVAWGLLVVPTVVFASSLLYTVLNPPPPPAPKPLPPAPKPEPQPEEPAVQLPDENTVCVELEFDSSPKPVTPPSCEVGADGTIGMPGTLPKPEPAPSCPSDIIGGVSADSLSGSGGSSTSASSTTQTLEDLLKSMNKSLTPVTVCPGA